MPTATAARTRKQASSPHQGLRCRVRLADGRIFAGELSAERHRRLQIGLLHEWSDGLVELAAGSRRDGRLQITTRRRADHFLPGGSAGRAGWLEALLELAAFHAGRGEELFVAPAVRSVARGDKHAVSESRWLWVDVDGPGQLHALWALLAERPCHLLVESGGSGGVHSYWKLDEPLAATRVTEETGELLEQIERANLRIVHRLGIGPDGKPNVADSACAERSRVMRLAGTVNGKAGVHARIIEADLALAPYPVKQLIGDLPDPTARSVKRASRGEPSTDPYKRIGPPEYFEKLAGIVVPADGLVSCPAPGHADRHPSCSVGARPETGWCCHSGGCGARGAIYDLASVLLGGPWGRELRGEAFKRARAYVADAFGEQTHQTTTSKGEPAMRAQAAARARGEPDIRAALMDAVDSIADMAQRVKRNGPEVTYASEKLAFALYKSAEALALCGVELEEAVTEVHRGHRHGR
jgi:hypothetical protein